MIITIYFTYLLTNRFSRPIVALKDAAQEIQTGNLSVRVPVMSSDEAGVLAAAFNSMIARIEVDTQVLKESEQKYKTLIETANDAIFIADVETGIIIDANKKAECLSGICRNELIGLYQSALYPPDKIDYYVETFRRHVTNNEPIDNNIYVRHRDGRDIPVDISAGVIEAGGRKVIFGIFRDISSKKLIEDQLKEKTRQLQEINKNLEAQVRIEIENRRRQEQMLIQQSKMASMGEVVALIAHQWKQPLNAIALTAQDLDDAFLYDELDRDYLVDSKDAILKQIDFMAKTIDGFRTFLRPSKEKALFNVKDSIKEVVSMFSPLFKKNGIILDLNQLDTEDSRSFNVLGYQNEFKQVILNLISNSRDAIVTKRAKEINDTHKEGRIIINLGEDRDKIVVSISDNGGGIPESLIDRIFEPYFTTKSADNGTGIGLYMSKTIIENNMNWKLTARNIRDGAEFRIVM
ncbi:MAG: PAS domain S-box protein [Nitrospirae bacterium]|nr:PAS domain S-box protein [Nitrospirota bacterium]